MIKRIGGAPVIIKILEGTQGVGVILAETTKVAEAIVETLQSARQNVLIQKFVKESKGKDIRAFIVGDTVIAAMRRVGQGDEYRGNVHRGGLTEQIQLDSAYEETAVRAAQIMEVNSSPGLEGIEGATGLDIAGAIIEYVANQVTVSKGYGVADVLVPDGSVLVNKTIADSGPGKRTL